MPKRSRKTKRSSRKKKARSTIPRHPRSKGLGRDSFTCTEIVSAGQLAYVGSNGVTSSGGVWLMNLTDFPAYATLGACFEFARLGKCEITYWPKTNMQTNLPYNNGLAVRQGFSMSGTLITGLDQIPLVGSNALTAVNPNWITDATETNVTVAKPYAFTSQGTLSPVAYVRGLSGSKETELYKKVRRTFYPAFYDLLMDAPGAGAGVGGTSGTCFERKIKKWINVGILNSGTSGVAGVRSQNVGPAYYGPCFALLVNNTSAVDASQTIPLYDVRMKYTISFKRLKGF